MDPNQNNQGQGPKRQLLQTLMQKVLGTSSGRSIHDVISGIKSALGAYKNYAKEWDTLHGQVQGQGGNNSVARNSLRQISRVPPMQNQAPLPQMPKQMPLPQMPKQMPMPQAPQSLPPKEIPQSYGVGWGP